MFSGLRLKTLRKAFGFVYILAQFASLLSMCAVTVVTSLLLAILSECAPIDMLGQILG